MKEVSSASIELRDLQLTADNGSFDELATDALRPARTDLQGVLNEPAGVETGWTSSDEARACGLAGMVRTVSHRGVAPLPEA